MSSCRATNAKAATSWRRFVSKAWHGLPVRVEELRLRYCEDGTLHPETVRTLDKRFNLDAPAPDAGKES